MLPQIPKEIVLIFILATLATLVLFMMAVRNSTEEQTRKKAIPIFGCLVIWLAVQAALTLNNIYNTNLEALPPKILLFGVLPPLLLVVLLFNTQGGKQFIDSLPLRQVTNIHMVRVPVEVVLFALFLHKTVPELMTFEGRNFDIIAGITAPLIAYLGFTKNLIPKKVLLFWNVCCLGLLLNIVVNGLLSAPTPFQQFAFTEPNIALLYFPFSWLPTFIVPMVLFSHLVATRQLLRPA